MLFISILNIAFYIITGNHLLSLLPWLLSPQAFFSANEAAQASRKSSPRVTNKAVQKAVSLLFTTYHFHTFLICHVFVFSNDDIDFCHSIQASALKGSDHRRAMNVRNRLEAQQKKLTLPILPTTTIGSFPQTLELRKLRREYKANKLVSSVLVLFYYFNFLGTSIKRFF